MRARMNIITTQMNSLKDYCGVTTGPPLRTAHLTFHPQDHAQYSPSTMSRLHHQPVTTIFEDDESLVEVEPTPYAGYITSAIFTDASGVGQLDRADHSIQSALTNFQENDASVDVRGQLSGGIGTFHTHLYERAEDGVQEPERLIIDGQRIRSTD